MNYYLDYVRTKTLWEYGLRDTAYNKGPFYVGFGYYVNEDELMSICWYNNKNIPIRLNEFYKVFPDVPNYFIYLDPNKILSNLSPESYRKMLETIVFPQFKKIMVSSKLRDLSKDFSDD